MMVRLTVVLPTTTLTSGVGLEALNRGGLAAAPSTQGSVLRGFGLNPKGDGPKALRGAGCGRAAGVGAGHPPPKAGPTAPGGLTCLPLEKWEASRVLAGGGAGEVLRG